MGRRWILRRCWPWLCRNQRLTEKVNGSMSNDAWRIRVCMCACLAREVVVDIRARACVLLVRISVTCEDLVPPPRGYKNSISTADRHPARIGLAKPRVLVSYVWPGSPVPEALYPRLYASMDGYTTEHVCVIHICVIQHDIKSWQTQC